ncbi:hypothetical protein D3C78_1040820 [compost metagenome]
MTVQVIPGYQLGELATVRRFRVPGRINGLIGDDERLIAQCFGFGIEDLAEALTTDGLNVSNPTTIGFAFDTHTARPTAHAALAAGS